MSMSPSRSASPVMTEWTPSATKRQTVLDGAGGFAPQTVAAGTYALAESTGPNGYTPSAWTCTGGTLGADGKSVTVANGAAASCSITNSDLPGTLELVKKVSNTHGGTAVPTDWSLSATLGTSQVKGDGGFGPTEVNAGAWTLAESGGPDGYTASEWMCTGGAVSAGVVTVPNGGAVSCEITNSDQAGTLELVKVVSNTHGGTAVKTDWTLSAKLGETVLEGAGGFAPKSADAGSYTLAEVAGANIPAGGYVAGDWVCTGGTQQGASVVVPNGGNVRCEITNSDRPAKLTLTKVVNHGDTGATDMTSDWTLTATPGEIAGQSAVSGHGDSAMAGGVHEVEVFAGAYDLSESGPAGYTADEAWVCTGAVASGSTVLVPSGGNVACTITNTAQQPTLTLVKTVTNSHGGSNVPTDWTLQAVGGTTISGTTGSSDVTAVPVRIGSYELSELAGAAVPVDGYVGGEWSCVGGTPGEGASVHVALGDQVTCTINNADQPAHLTLVKVVDGQAAGSGRVPADWKLTAKPAQIEGQQSVSGNGNPESAGGVKSVPVFAGSYALSEDGPSGFNASQWVCEGGVVTVDEAGKAAVSIRNGGNVVCQITNTARSPLLTLVKVVDVGQTGSSATAADWSLIASGPTPISGISGSATVTSAPVQVGTYTLSESAGPAGFTPSAWKCEGATVTGSSITLAEGDNATCTIVNTAQAARWTVTKSSSPGSNVYLTPGSVITYYVTATKLGGINPTNIVVSDDLTDVFTDATLVPGSLSAPSGTTAFTGAVLTWNIPELATSSTLTYQVRINDNAFGRTLVNSATGLGAEPCVSTEATQGVTIADCDTTVHYTTDPVVDDLADSEGDGDTAVLAFTGATAMGAGAFGLGLFGLGVLAVLISRRRRTEAEG